MTQKKGDENMNASKEIQDEMVGVLTAISIVSKRLASRLLDLDNEPEDEQKKEEQERSK
ncbi:hypothetical protein [Anaerotalea alkaliphila]|jgi:hypothetical protein|uniref:hypothetical protein n=1 Tax=Anaerotalea alkaliphila TaxID=2662126 RepID=UPI0013915419|nr:hypothetical protein [Anaerotalea alkaliphila]